MSIISNNSDFEVFNQKDLSTSDSLDELTYDFHSIPLDVVGALLEDDNLSILLNSLESYKLSGNVSFLLQAVASWAKYLDMSIARLFLMYGSYIKQNTDASICSSSSCIDKLIYEILHISDHSSDDVSNDSEVLMEVVYLLLRMYLNHVTRGDLVDLPFVDVMDSNPSPDMSETSSDSAIGDIAEPLGS